MRLLLLIVVMMVIPATSFSQVSDFITVKKRNNRTLKTYFPGSIIAFQTVYGNYLNGIIQAIRHDSVFVKEYDIRAVPNEWGLHGLIH